MLFGRGITLRKPIIPQPLIYSNPDPLFPPRVAGVQESGRVYAILH